MNTPPPAAPVARLLSFSRCRLVVLTHRGALNAYTRAISLDDSHPGLYGNRAACRLALGEWEGAAEDCDAALELLAEQRDRWVLGGGAGGQCWGAVRSSEDSQSH